MCRKKIIFLITILLFIGSPGWLYSAGITIPAGSTFNVATGTLNVSGDLTNAGTLTSTTGTIKLTGNWAKTGTFTSGTGTVTFDGETGITGSTISGTTTFYNLTCTTANKYLYFTAGTTQTVSNSLTLTGTSGNLIKIRSTAAAVAYLTLPADKTQSLSYLDVQWNDASGGQTLAAGPTSTGSNTTSWTFTILSVSVSPSTWAIGLVEPGAAAQIKGAAIVVTNNGNVAETFRLNLTEPANWTSVVIVGNVASNVYALGGIFRAASSSTPLTSDYIDSQDYLTTSAVTASATVFAMGGVAAGVNVAVSGTCDLWLMFKAPTASTSAASQTITVTVTAIAAS